MKNSKRIISFVMAMIILTSFFCYNVGASNNPSYARYEFTGNFFTASFSDTNAFAFVRISNWAEEENTTDLRASTYAHIGDYEDRYNLYDVVTYVDLVVWLEDGSESRISDVGYVDPDVGTSDAFVHGRECLNYDDHYSIVDFESTHKVDIRFYVFDAYGNIVDIDEANDGPIIEIATFD